MVFNSFEDIQAWQDARMLMKIIRSICKRSNVRQDKVWIDQITKACLSIMANIAEGFDSRSDAEFANFAGYAKRSSTEVKSHLYYGLDERYVNESEFKDASDLTGLICLRLSKLIYYLQSVDRKTRRNPISRPMTNDQ